MTIAGFKKWRHFVAASEPLLTARHSLNQQASLFSHPDNDQGLKQGKTLASMKQRTPQKMQYQQICRGSDMNKLPAGQGARVPASACLHSCGRPLSTSHPILCASICELTWRHLCKLRPGHGMWRLWTLVFYCAEWSRTDHCTGSHSKRLAGSHMQRKRLAKWSMVRPLAQRMARGL